MTCLPIKTLTSRRYSLRPSPGTDVMRDTTGQHRLYSAPDCHSVCSIQSSCALHLISANRQSVSALAGTLRSEAGGRDQFLRHNQVKRSMPSRMKWTGSGISFNVNMTEKPPVRSDIWELRILRRRRTRNEWQAVSSFVRLHIPK